jgi:hypothetical protein
MREIVFARSQRIVRFQVVMACRHVCGKGRFVDDQIAAREATHGTLGRLGSLADIEIAALPFRIDP